MKKYLLLSACIISLFVFPSIGICKNSHYFKIIAKGEIAIDFPSGTLEPGAGTSPSEQIQIANTENTIKILMVRRITLNGEDRSLPHINNNTNFIIDVIESIYNPETDEIIIRRNIQNVDSVNSRNYPSAIFTAKWYLLKESIISK